MDSKLIQCANPAQDDARADRFFLFIDRTALSPIIIEETRGLALRPRFRMPHLPMISAAAGGFIGSSPINKKNLIFLCRDLYFVDQPYIVCERSYFIRW